MANIFDQFDESRDSANVFDQFDTPEVVGEPAQTERLSRREQNQAAAQARMPKDIDIDAMSQGLDPSLVESLREQSFISDRGGKRFSKSKMAKLLEFEKLRISNPALVAEIENTGPVDAFLIGAGRGLTAIPRAVGAGFEEDETTRANLNRFIKDTPGAATGELVGEVAPFVPFSLAAGTARTLAGRTLLQGGVGASEGGLIAKSKGFDTEKVVKSAGLGLFLGAGSEILLPAFNRIARARLAEEGIAVRTDEALISGDGISEKLQKSLDDAGLSQSDFFVDAAARAKIPEAAREDVFRKLGVEPTRAQVTRDPSLFGRQLEASADVGPVRDALTRQERILTDVTQGKIDDIGGVPARASDSPIEAITDKSLQLDAKISSLYKQARDMTPDAKNIKFSRSSGALKRGSPIDTRTEGTVKAISSEMKRLGFLDAKGAATSRTSVEAAESLRQFANTLFDGANPLAKNFIRDFKDALDDDVFSAAGKDLFKEARAEKTSFMQGLASKKGHKFDQRETSLVRDVLEGGVQGDDIVGLVLRRGSRYKAKEIRELKQYLHSGTEGQTAQGVQAWNDIRAAAMDDIAAKSFVGPTNELGAQTLTRAGLKRALDGIGEKKINVLFSHEEISFLRDLARLATLKEAPAGVIKSPSGAAIRQLESTLSRVPVLGSFAGSTVSSLKTKANNKQILKLIDDAKAIEKANEDAAQRAFRNSIQGQAASLAPAAAIPLISSDK